MGTAVAVYQRLGSRRAVGIGRRQLLVFVGIAAAYIGAAKLGLALSVAHGVITPVWPPTGIALAALLLLGPRYWPAITLGAFVSNVTSGVSADVALAISIGNTLEALVAVYLLRRVDFRPSLDRTRDIMWLTVLAACVSTAIAATNGVTTLALAGSPAASPYGSAWLLWWLGDAMGVLLVAPVLLIAATRPPQLRPARLLEALGLLALLAGTSAAIFFGGQWRYPYPIFPLLVVATLRFRQPGATIGCLVVAGIAIAGVVSGASPLAADATTTVQILQALLAFAAVSLLVLGATLSEREQATESLAEAQALAHIGSWEWDIATDRVTWSRELHRIFGLDSRAGKLTYAKYLARIHPADRELARSEIARALETRQPFEVQHRIVLDDGTERVVHGRGRVVVDSSGAPLRLVGTSQDVTERQRVEEVRDNILSAVSHELRTPLTSVLGFALTLEQRPDDAARRQMTSALVAEARRLEHLLSDLLDVDRLRHGLVHVTLEPTDVTSLVERTIAAVKTLDGNRISLNAAEIVAEVDAAKLERIVDNLVTNALKHTPPGTGVSVSVSAGSGRLLLRVDDSGEGVPDELKQQIFEPFVRVNGAGGAPGTGIGLALVAQFAALQGGKAWVEDRPGGGASFRVSLPLGAR
ncbi:MAG TPA: MASE1 domain-containing protein [Gaiellaceae bacterium]